MSVISGWRIRFLNKRFNYRKFIVCYLRSLFFILENKKKELLYRSISHTIEGGKLKLPK